MQPDYEQQPPNFLHALAGLLFAPRETIEDLMANRENPPYAATLIVCLVLSLWIPALAQCHKYGYDIFESYALIRISFLLGVAFVIFLLAETLFLRGFGSACSVRLVFTSIAYAWAPFILCIWLIYAFNFFVSGHLTLITMFILGFGSVGEPFSTVLPYALAICSIWVLLIYCYALQGVLGLRVTSATIAALFSIVPALLSLLLALVLCEVLWPGTVRMVIDLCASS